MPSRYPRWVSFTSAQWVSFTPALTIYRMEHLPSDPCQDNPLKITNDARKAGLDFRLIDPNAPDFEGSKVNVAINEMVRIWQKWRDKRGTQLVFCDLSTPKLSKSARDPNAYESINIDHDEKREAELSMDEILASSHSNQFNVYDDVKAKLIARGVPIEEIRFIHEAKTDVQRAQLFKQVRCGTVRFLIGSTAKMGAGMNVQTRLVAEHHLDAPWRPRDLEQREGRIIRQGNLFYDEDPDGFEVEINRYATKQTYDSRMWQTIECKAGAIEQFRSGDSVSRVIEDVAGEAANAAEMKAAATGNPLIFLQVQFAADLKKMEALYANDKHNRHVLESKVDWLTKADDRANRTIEIYKQEIKRRDANTTQEWAIQVGQHSFNAKSKEPLMMSILSNIQQAIEGRAKMLADKPQVITIGKYRGFTVTVSSSQDQIMFRLKGENTYEPINLRYQKDDKFSVTGFLKRLDHFLDSFEEYIEAVQHRRTSELIELDKAKRELGKPFAQLRELELIRKNAGDVMVELKKMQNDSAYVSTWTPTAIESVQSHEGDLFNLDGPLATGRTQAATPGREKDAEFIEQAAQDDSLKHHKPLHKEALTRRHAQRLEEDGEDTHATETVFDTAESVVICFKETAKLKAKEAGLCPELAQRDHGMYAGRIVAITDHYFIQDTGLRKGVLHDLNHLLMAQNTKVGDYVRVSYSDGGVLVRTHEQSSVLTR